jgi:uncharacterized membrane protein YjfL (UPF0719 family)
MKYGNSRLLTVLLTIIALVFVGFNVMAATTGAAPSGWHATDLTGAIVNTLIFGGIGVVLTIIAFKLFDLCIKRINFEEEIRKGNVSAGIVCGAVVLAAAIVVAAAIL